jgi:NCS2 family nucleobase:cation symporter-2/xanthine permease XanP
MDMSAEKREVVVEEKPTFGLEDRPPFAETMLLGLQHMLAMFVGIITPPLIIAGVAGLNAAETGFFVSMALMVSGVTTYIQVTKFGPVGSGLLAVHGTSFTFVPMAIAAASQGGLPLVIGMGLITSPVEMILSRFIRQTRNIFPPVVTGTVVMLIGLGLMEVGITDFGGGAGAENYGAPQNLLLGIFVLTIIIIANRFGKGLVKVGAVAIGLIIGYFVSIPLGLVDLTEVAEAGWLTIPQPFKYGISFEWGLLAPWIMAYIITTVESIGDLTAVAEVSGEAVDNQQHIDRLSGGIMADGVGSALAAVFNSLPNSTFSQNIGVIQITKVGSKVVGLAVAAILFLLGLVPKIGALVSVMPSPVLGGATIALFGMVATSGMKIVTKGGLTDRKIFILSIALSFGLGVTFRPDVVAQLPEILSTVLSSGITVGALIAIALNLILPKEEKTIC